MFLNCLLSGVTGDQDQLTPDFEFTDNLSLYYFVTGQPNIHNIFLFVGLTVQKLDPRVEKMFEGVKEILTRYRSGKLPKAFKLIPRLTNWEQILHITGWLYFIWASVNVNMKVPSLSLS